MTILNLVESPELLRFQLLASGFEDAFSVEDDLDAWGTHVGDLLSSAVTTFLYVPPSRQVSLAMDIIFGVSQLLSPRQLGLSEVYVPGIATDRQTDEVYSLFESLGPYRSLRTVLDGGGVAGAKAKLGVHVDDGSRYECARTFTTLAPSIHAALQHTKACDGHTSVSVAPLQYKHMELPFVRCDIVNMTRYVHHHYDYRKDGHSRTYTMRVLVNSSLSDSLASQAHLALRRASATDGGKQPNPNEGPQGAMELMRLRNEYRRLQSKQTREGILLRAKMLMYIPDPSAQVRKMHPPLFLEKIRWVLS